jgi:enoyl-CoA hydratase/carnithine racemase
MSVTRQPHLLTSTEDAVLVATLNRPEKLNVLDAETLSLLESALHRFRDSPELKVMLIRATGRYFCAGADLLSRGGADSPSMGNSGSSIREFHRLRINGMQRIYDEMEAVEKPIVVAHHATCMGGGLELSLSCDFRLAAASASYAFPEGKIGVLPASNGVSRLTRIVGTHWARYLIMANLPVGAERALVMGLVHEVYPDASFETDAMNFCRHLAQQSAEQMGTAKLAIEMAMDVGLAQARNVERLANSALMLGPDYQSRIESYIQGIGRKPGDPE